MVYKRSGFTLVEMLAVLLILSILLAIATPMYLAHVRRARASEAVAAMSLIRQAERDYFTRHSEYLDVASGDLPNDPEAAESPGLDIVVGTAQYFSNAAYSVQAGATHAQFASPAAVDFIITADGSQSVNCAEAGSADCAIRQNDVRDYRLMMDNSGRVFISYNAGADWRGW